MSELRKEYQAALDKIACAIIEAYVAKQKEPAKPKTMKFRAVQFGSDTPVMRRYDRSLPPGSRWVSEIIEVTIEEQS